MAFLEFLFCNIRNLSAITFQPVVEKPVETLGESIGKLESLSGKFTQLPHILPYVKS
jgi:hypothetical protein